MCVYVIEYTRVNIEVPVLSTLLNLFVPELFDCVFVDLVQKLGQV